jgi:nitroreductase
MTTLQDTGEAFALSTDAQDLLFREARTANTFTDEPVSDEQIQAIYDLVKWGPTSANQQPLRIVLVRSTEARERLLQHMSAGNRDKTAAAPLVAILAEDLEFPRHFGKIFPHKPQIADAFADEAVRDRSARINASLQIAYLLLGIRAAGLAAGPMTGFNNGALDRDFFPDGTLRSLVVVNIGKPGPDAWFDRLPRHDYDTVVSTI